MPVEAHYWRAKEDLEGHPVKFQKRVHGSRYVPGYELDIDIYTRHWMAARIESDSSFMGDYPEAWKIIEEEFGYTPEKNRFLPPGHSIYVDPSAL